MAITSSPSCSPRCWRSSPAEQTRPSRRIPARPSAVPSRGWRGSCAWPRSGTRPSRCPATSSPPTRSCARPSGRTPRNSLTGEPRWGEHPTERRWVLPPARAVSWQLEEVPGEGSHPWMALPPPNPTRAPDPLIPRVSFSHLCRRFLYEYSSSYSQAPLPVLVGSTRTFLSMVSTCCISSAPPHCFLREVRPFGGLGLPPSSLPGEPGKLCANCPGKRRTFPFSFCGRNWRGKPSPYSP